MDIYETYWVKENERLLPLRTNVALQIPDESDLSANAGTKKTGSNSLQNKESRKSKRKEKKKRREEREKLLKKKKGKFLWKNLH